MERFPAIVADKDGEKIRLAYREIARDDLPDLPVLVAVEASGLNYKDGLALSGASRIFRKTPLICGIDLAGRVVESADPAWKAGDAILVNGWGLSEKFDGGYSRYQRLRPEWLTRRPDGLTAQDAMAIGTAGYTAMLCVMALEDAGLKPGATVLVTGAAGGVGSVAVAILAHLGYRVTASTGRAETQDYLRDLGAVDIIGRDELLADTPALAKERWDGAVDSVGGKTLAHLLAQIKYGGAVAACGLAGGSDLPATVFPFILRNVRLQGVDSVMASQEKRHLAWSRLVHDLPMEKLRAMTEVWPMSELIARAGAILKGQVRGRVVVDVAA